ncbi:LLM class flavin-dependent oxidoreductase [Desertibaculum subflavum]|uniref:LLM class flavin-dependent oxidoreductase n=1 Tax=Desertibaculum subflavum TaxID=2268458 RepID=UPI000E6746B5
MKFSLFMYCTIGRRAELEGGLAGRKPELYQRMLDEIADYARLADDAGFFGFGHPEHHLQIEGFEISNDPRLMGMWLGRHTKRLRVITCGFVSTTHNPLRTAEDIATMDHMLGGRFGVGLVRGYQARWVENFKIRGDLNAVGPWNKDSPADVANREYFTEFVDVVVKALKSETFSHRGKYWQFPPPGFVNPHDHPVYRTYGKGVDPQMNIAEIGIAPRPLQTPHPPLYGGFAASMRTATFWAKYGGKPIVLTDNLDFYGRLVEAYRGEAEKHGTKVARGQEAAWGGICICAPTDAQAKEWLQDMLWFWNSWAVPFGQGLPELLVGSPDTISRRLDEVKQRFPDQDEVVLLIPQGIHTPDQIRTSLDLMAKHVLPRFA